MNKFGVILARIQPVHNGHMALIKKACEENESVVILVGSANKVDSRNPIPVSIRIEMLKDALKEADLINKCKIVPLDDLTTESDNSIEWGFYLYTKIVDQIKDSCFTMYYSDGFEIITKWFPGFMFKNNVSLVLLARGTVEDGVSATEVRKAILDENQELKNMVPKSVYNNRNTIKSFIELNKEK